MIIIGGFKVVQRSLEFFSVNIKLIPFLEYAVSQYAWRLCLMRVNICVNKTVRGLVEHLQ